MKLLPQLEYRPPDGSDPSFVAVDLDHPDSWPRDGSGFALALAGLAAFSITDVEHASGQLYDVLVEAIPQFTPAQPGDSLLAVFMTCHMHNLDAGLPAREAEQRAQAQYVNLLRHAAEVFEFPDEDAEAALESGIRLQMERLADPRLLKPPELEHLSRHMLLRAAALAASGRPRRSQDPVPEEETPEPAVPEPSSESAPLPSGEEPAKPKKKMGLGRLINIILVVVALAVPLLQRLTRQPAAPRRPEQAGWSRTAPAKPPPGSSVESRIAWTGDASVRIGGARTVVPVLDGFSEARIKDGQFLAISGSTGPDRRYVSISLGASGSGFTEYSEQLRDISRKTGTSAILDREEGVAVLLPVSLAATGDDGISGMFGEEMPGDLAVTVMALNPGRLSLRINVFAEDTPENRSWMEKTLPEWCGAVIQANKP